MEPTTVTSDALGCYDWRKTWVFWPKTTINGKTVYCCEVYKRRVISTVDSKHGTYSKQPETQYATFLEILVG